MQTDIQCEPLVFQHSKAVFVSVTKHKRTTMTNIQHHYGFCQKHNTEMISHTVLCQQIKSFHQYNIIV